MDDAEAERINRIFHDHECAYYDERFAIVHDERSARRALREIEDLLGRPVRADETVLDAGCGTGWLAAGLPRAVPGLSVIGVDLSQGMIEGARAAGAWPLLRADAQRLPLATASVDLIVTRGTLHHLPDVPAALTEWRRVLRPGGAVVVSCEPTPATEAHSAPLVRALLRMLHRPLSPEEDFWEVASIAANLHVFTPAQLRTMATGAGYREVSLSTRYFCATLLLTASYVTHSRRPGLARAGTVAAAGIARFQPGRRGDQPGAARNVAPRRRRRTAPLKPERWPQLRHVERSVAEFAPNTFRTAFIPLQPYQATAAAALSDHRHQRR